jgi:hypothetical protein
MKMYLNFPNESKTRILHPGTARETGERGYTAELEESDLAVAAGQDVFVYYEISRKLVKQAARIDAVMTNDPALTVGFQLTGDIVSAESREWYRVSTALVGLTADFGPERNCRLLDVSSVGFAVEATKQYDVGNTVPVTLHFEGEHFAGDARVQSIQELRGGQFRYGLHSLTYKSSGGDLRKGQQQISTAVERAQLRRLAGSG